MVITPVMHIGRTTPGKIQAQHRAVVVNVKKDEMRRHERMLEYRCAAKKSESRLEDAMMALKMANLEITRLTNELAAAKATIAAMESKAVKPEKAGADRLAEACGADKAGKPEKPKRARRRKPVANVSADSAD